MIYEKQVDLIALKNQAGITTRELANAVGCSPATVSAKLCGFVILTVQERLIIERVCREAIEELEKEKVGKNG